MPKLTHIATNSVVTQEQRTRTIQFVTADKPHEFASDRPGVVYYGNYSNIGGENPTDILESDTRLRDGVSQFSMTDGMGQSANKLRALMLETKTTSGTPPALQHNLILEFPSTSKSGEPPLALQDAKKLLAPAGFENSVTRSGQTGLPLLVYENVGDDALAKAAYALASFTSKSSGQGTSRHVHPLVGEKNADAITLMEEVRLGRRFDAPGMEEARQRLKVESSSSLANAATEELPFSPAALAIASNAPASGQRGLSARTAWTAATPEAGTRIANIPRDGTPG